MEIGKTLITIGIFLIIIGAAVYFAGRFTSLGRLPGDIFIKKENFSFYFPITTSIIVSVILSLIFYLWQHK